MYEDCFVEEEDRYYQEEFVYSRYWHGYNVFLRPLLVVFDYFQMEILFGIIFLILFIILEKVIYKDLGKFYALAMMFSLFSISYQTLWLSLALVPTIIIMMIASIIVIIKYDKIKDFGIFFLIIGSVTNFFGWMNFQFNTLTIPLMLFYLKKKDNNYSFKEFFKLCFMWGLGFGLTWIAKWGIADTLYNTNTIRDGILQCIYRTGESVYEYGNANAALSLVTNILCIIIPILIQYFILVTDRMFKNREVQKVNKKEMVIYLLILSIPFLTCILFKNHSYLHARSFVYRNFIILVFNIFVIYHKKFLEKSTVS